MWIVIGVLLIAVRKGDYVDPRNNADDAFQAFMSMEESEWNALLVSISQGGVLQPEEQKGFDRACLQKDVKKDVVPDYSGEVAPPSHGSEVVKRLSALVVQMAQLELAELDLEEQLKQTKKDLKQYRDNLIPEIMAEIGVPAITTAGGITIEVEDKLHASFPKDEGKQAIAFAWLKESGNDGMIKREITVRYGRDSVKWAEELMQKMEEWQIGEHATVDQEWNIHHQTLLAFLRNELKDGHPVPLEVFGAYVQRQAKIKRAK